MTVWLIPPHPKLAAQSMKRSMAWADRCKQTLSRAWRGRDRNLFGIVQGGVYPDLRKESAERLIEMDFPGYAIGGLAVGEPNPVMYDVIEHWSRIFPRTNRGT